MACEFGTDISVIFQRSAMTTYPREVDFRAESDKYNHAHITFSEGAGQKIAKAYREAEPVTVQFAGEPAFRAYLPPDNIEFRRQLDRPTTAELSLHAPIQVLNRGTISKSLHYASVREAVEYVFENRDDPNNVLRGFRFMDQADANRAKTNVTSAMVGDVGGAVEFVFDVVPFLNEDEVTNGFEWDGISPLEAFADILNEFNLDYRVTTDGILVIGTFGASGDSFLVTAPDGGDFTLSRYDVTTSANKTNAVRIRGAYRNVRAHNGEGGQAPGQKLQPYAEATATGLSGDALELEAKNVSNLAELESIATRALVQEVMGDANGSMTIDAMASPDPDDLAELDVGDHIVVDPSVSEHCPGDVITGPFLVQKLHHKASQSRGWTTNVDVSQVVFPSNVSVNTFWYDPATDQRFDSLESYNEFTQDALGEGAFLPTDFSDFFFD